MVAEEFEAENPVRHFVETRQPMVGDTECGTLDIESLALQNREYEILQTQLAELLHDRVDRFAVPLFNQIDEVAGRMRAELAYAQLSELYDTVLRKRRSAAERDPE